MVLKNLRLGSEYLLFTIVLTIRQTDKIKYKVAPPKDVINKTEVTEKSLIDV